MSTARRSRSAAAGASAAVDALLARRLEANEPFFEREAARIARVCRELADQFGRGGRLLAVGASAQSRSDARHVAVEFVHPVIVGKRALPALALSHEDAELLRAPDDIVVTFEPLTVGEERFDVLDDDPFVRQELTETLYHVLWELVHVFLDRRGTASGDAGPAAFLYPFLGPRAGEDDAVLEDVSRSVVAKAREVSALRKQTLTENAAALVAAASALRRSLDAGGKLLAFGNGGSATDAMDLVADFRAAPQGWPSRPALDLTEDSAILTALANDVGTEVLFQRQVIAYGGEGDVALAISTSGGSPNIVAALAEARRRGLVTIALVGYDGGRIATERLADHVVVTRSEHVPRIQEAQATAYHALRELVEEPPG